MADLLVSCNGETAAEQLTAAWEWQMTCPEQQHGNEPLGGLAPSGLRVWGMFAASRQMRAARYVLGATRGSRQRVTMCALGAAHAGNKRH